MPCPNCGGADITVLEKRKGKRPVRLHFDFHYEGKCNACGMGLWRHGHDGEKNPTWAKPSQMVCDGCY